jgi:hypothetical protein
MSKKSKNLGFHPSLDLAKEFSGQSVDNVVWLEVTEIKKRLARRRGVEIRKRREAQRALAKFRERIYCEDLLVEGDDFLS